MMLLNTNQKNQLANLVLRLSSLGAKLILTLYMARFFDLSALGVYGLVFSAVILSGAFLGQEFSYIVKREIVGLEPTDALQKIRDQIIWYAANYALLALVVFGLIVTNAIDIPAKYLIYILVLGVSESLGTVLYNNMNLFNQQLWANVAFFVRAASWVPFVIVLGFVDESFRTEDTVLICWAIGSIAALGVPLWVWRDWGWAAVAKRPIQWDWLFNGLKRGSFIWFGILGTVLGSYIDRYFVNHFLSLELVGVMTFYYSFVNAFEPLVESGILTFTAPRLVASHKKKDGVGFWREAGQAAWQVGIGMGVLALFLSVFVPFLGQFLGKEAFVEQIDTFLLLLVAAWIHAFSLVPYYILFAQHRDKPIWIGNILYVIPVLACNFIFIPQLGFLGVGYSAIVSSLFLLFWRAKFIQWPKNFFQKKKI